jgi:hypothetical protein
MSKNLYDLNQDLKRLTEEEKSLKSQFQKKLDESHYRNLLRNIFDDVCIHVEYYAIHEEPHKILLPYLSLSRLQTYTCYRSVDKLWDDVKQLLLEKGLIMQAKIELSSKYWSEGILTYSKPTEKDTDTPAAQPPQT